MVSCVRRVSFNTMTDNSLDLYGPVIKELAAKVPAVNPEGDSVVYVDAINRMCGDKFRFYLDSPNGYLDGVTGYGCLLSKASCALLVQHCQGRAWSEVDEICKSFLSYLRGEGSSLFDGDEQAEAFMPVKQYPGRIKCVTLGWEAVATHASAKSMQS